MGESSRKDKAQKLQGEVFDVVIIGGGINGAVAAAALSASNLRVALLERGDFASSTSQESSNLVWGGIKYLETYEFSLVWDLCRSRNELMHHYPDAVQELRFFTSLARGF
ncbi:MAG: FAD-dependent oxidoreductase, partial [Proteobacteria bacterium]|nr:FAD-dependent oxidoreductase [Pseudomonadota bacterium]